MYEVKACRSIEFGMHHGSYWLHMGFDNVTAMFDVVGLYTLFCEFKEAGISVPTNLVGKLFEARWKSVDGEIHDGQSYAGEQLEAIRIHPSYCKAGQEPNWVRVGVGLMDKEDRERIYGYLVRKP